MKNPKETKTEVDLTVPLDITKLSADEDDCFGKEWDPQDKDCALCHDVEICGIVHQGYTQAKKTKIEKDKGPFLDMTDFDRVPMDKITANLKSWAEENDPGTLQELEDTIAERARTKDKVAIREYIKRTLPRYNLRITENKTIIPNESTVHNLNTDSPLIEGHPV